MKHDQLLTPKHLRLVSRVGSHRAMPASRHTHTHTRSTVSECPPHTAGWAVPDPPIRTLRSNLDTNGIRRLDGEGGKPNVQDCGRSSGWQQETHKKNKSNKNNTNHSPCSFSQASWNIFTISLLASSTDETYVEIDSNLVIRCSSSTY